MSRIESQVGKNSRFLETYYFLIIIIYIIIIWPYMSVVYR